jgi:peptidoglycan/xylan/chitin deacetylase (PgdA/CDA1 family)
VLSLSELIMRLRNDNPLEKNLMAITFDDGFRDGYVHILPILKGLSITATFFVSPLLTAEGSLPWHDILRQYLSAARQEISLTIEGRTFLIRPGRDLNKIKKDITNLLSSLPDNKRKEILEEIRKALGLESFISPKSSPMLTREDIILMRKSGFAEFGAHSMTHPVMSECSKTQIVTEVLESKRMLESILNEPVRSFAYPFGIYTPEAVEAVSSGGFEAAVTTNDGLVQKNDNIFLLNRINVVRDDSMISLLTKKIMRYYFTKQS